MDKSLLNIRKVQSKDARAWFVFGFKVWRNAYKNIFPEEVFIDRESKLEEKVKDFDNKLQNNEKSIAYVAEYNGEIVGTMCGSISSSYNNFDKYADLIGLYVDPRFQGYGIGTKFKNIFENWAIENGATQYVIGVLKDNTKARKVYESWGGKLSDVEEDFVKLGVGYPEVFYTYDLQKDLMLYEEDKKMEKIDREIVLKRIGNSIITDKFSVLKIEKKDVDKILESKILDFEQKKEILEKVKLLQFFSEEYISYTTPPTRNNAERFLLSAERIFNVNNQSEFETEINELDKILEFCKDVVLHPFNSTEKKMEQERYENEVYKKGGKF